MNNEIKKLIVLSSGFGSNLQSIIDKVHGYDDIIISLIISDKPSFSIKRSIKANINCLFYPKIKNQDFIKYDLMLSRIINIFNPDYLILSGFMHILSSDFVDIYPNKIINIHPSLLPKYKGLHTHQRVLDNKDILHGTTVHFVNKNLDSGKIIAQKSFKVIHSDTQESLKNKIKSIENNFYPYIIKQLCKNKI